MVTLRSLYLSLCEADLLSQRGQPNVRWYSDTEAFVTWCQRISRPVLDSSNSVGSCPLCSLTLPLCRCNGGRCNVWVVHELHHMNRVMRLVVQVKIPRRTTQCIPRVFGPSFLTCLVACRGASGPSALPIHTMWFSFGSLVHTLRQAVSPNSACHVSTVSALSYHFTQGTTVRTESKSLEQSCRASNQPYGRSVL